MSIRSRFIQLLVIWPDQTHWPTQPPTLTHGWECLQIINLQTELNYLDSVNNFQIFSDLTWPHPSTHPPTHQIIHPPMSEEVSTDFKSLNRIEISRLVQVLLNFEWFRGPPLGGGGWVDGGGGGEGVGGWGWWWWGGAPHPCAHTCTYMHAYAHACAYDIIGNPRDFPKSNGGSHLREITVFTTHACACVCMCTCVGSTPNHPPPPSNHPLTPKSHRKPKTPKFNKSWTNRDNSILFEDSLPLNIPELI